MKEKTICKAEGTFEKPEASFSLRAGVVIVLEVVKPLEFRVGQCEEIWDG